jgi:hypothetical protein
MRAISAASAATCVERRSDDIEGCSNCLWRSGLTDTNDWYRWRVNPDIVPSGVVLPRGNEYAQNVALKVQLCNLYSTGDDCRKQEIARYYIAEWGGIHGNHAETIRAYALAAPASLIARGSRGIASWSKALCIRRPDKYAVYDARVAVSLNCLQIVRHVDLPVRFPLLSSRNKLIERGKKAINRHASENGWQVAQQDNFYEQYKSLLSSAAFSTGAALYTLEMLLFAKAPKLLGEAFPKEGFRG